MVNYIYAVVRHPHGSGHPFFVAFYASSRKANERLAKEQSIWGISYSFNIQPIEVL